MSQSIKWAPYAGGSSETNLSTLCAYVQDSCYTLNLVAKSTTSEKSAHLNMSTVWAQCVGGWCGDVDSVTGCSRQKRALKCVSNHSTSAWHAPPPPPVKRSWKSVVKSVSRALQVAMSSVFTSTESVMIFGVGNSTASQQLAQTLDQDAT